MSKKHQTGEATPSVKDLKAAIEWIDALSQESTARIMAIAKLSLLAMEAPALHIEHLAQAFKVIEDLALSLENHINSHAERFGCNYQCKENSRRIEAYMAKEEGQS